MRKNVGPADMTMDDPFDAQTNVDRRVFLVGCPRSGTTILQRCISSHSRVTSFPETDFFAKLIGRRKGLALARINRIGGDRSRRAWGKMEQVFGGYGFPDELSNCRSLAETVGKYTAFLDSIACSRGCDRWLEKTPRHFRYVDLIARLVPSSVFVHVVRDGRAVVGSIVDRAICYPERFGSERDAVQAAGLWNEAIQRTAERVRRSDDLIVHYEEFVERPDNALRDICKKIGVEYEPEMVSGQPDGKITESGESWKDSVHLGVVNMKDKFDEVLAENERHLVSRVLDWSTYRHLQNLRGSRERTT